LFPLWNKREREREREMPEEIWFTGLYMLQL